MMPRRLLVGWLDSLPRLGVGFPWAALWLIGGCAGCQTINGSPTIPHCPSPTAAMIFEAQELYRMPAIARYLGEVELYCEGIEAMNQ